jgi:hypothetical protein
VPGHDFLEQKLAEPHMRRADHGQFSTDPQEAAGFAKFSVDQEVPSGVAERSD